jgi:hypothetical protein
MIREGLDQVEEQAAYSDNVNILPTLNICCDLGYTLYIDPLLAN